MSDYKGAVLRVLLKHSPAATTGDATACRCDRTWRPANEQQAHIADALLADAVEALVAERDAYAQGLWDAFAALGYDTDGDPTPAAAIGGMGSTGFVESILRDVREYRLGSEKDYEEVVAERDALRAQLDSMTTDWAVRVAPVGGYTEVYSKRETGGSYDERLAHADADYYREALGNANVMKRLVGPWTPVEGEQA
jgi:hypothetical protein